MATMALTELAEKGPDVDVLRQLIPSVAQRLIDMRVEPMYAAGNDVRSGERTNVRKRYRDRARDTRAISVDLKFPKL